MSQMSQTLEPMTKEEFASLLDDTSTGYAMALSEYTILRSEYDNLRAILAEVRENTFDAGTKLLRLAHTIGPVSVRISNPASDDTTRIVTWLRTAYRQNRNAQEIAGAIERREWGTVEPEK